MKKSGNYVRLLCGQSTNLNDNSQDHMKLISTLSITRTQKLNGCASFWSHIPKVQSFSSVQVTGLNPRTPNV